MGRRINILITSLIIPFLLTIMMLIFARLGEGGRGKGGGSFLVLLGDLTGFFALYSLILVMLIGVPMVQVWFSKKTSLKRKDFVNLHCDLAIVTLIFSITHVVILAQTSKWDEYIDFYSIYPKIFLPIEGFFSNNLGLTFGVWALFFMFIATLSGYFRGKVYRSVGRRIFLLTQDITVISLIIIVLHALLIGRITSENMIVFIFLVVISSLFLIAWVWSQVKDIQKYIKKKQKRKKNKTSEPKLQHQEEKMKISKGA
ncbi:MAG: hypothetical protein ACTSQE_06095 [Candidatus Heimdallarchaeaceae archaeon]